MGASWLWTTHIGTMSDIVISNNGRVPRVQVDKAASLLAEQMSIIGYL